MQVFIAPVHKGRQDNKEGQRTRRGTRDGSGMRAAGPTDLSHARGRVDVALHAREDGAVVSQKDAFLVSAAALELAGLVRGAVDDAHGGLRHPSFRSWGLFHSYCACRRWSSGGRIVGYGLVREGMRTGMRVCDEG